MTSPQSRFMSLVEASTNTALGFGVSVAANLLILPLFGFPIHLGPALSIGAIFTLISIIRSYLLRRLFEFIRTKSPW